MTKRDGYDSFTTLQTLADTYQPDTSSFGFWPRHVLLQPQSFCRSISCWSHTAHLQPVGGFAAGAVPNSVPMRLSLCLIQLLSCFGVSDCVAESLCICVSLNALVVQDEARYPKAMHAIACRI